MKVLIYFNKNDLKPTGGPVGYLYNLHQELIKEKIDYIDFLDIKKPEDSIIRKMYLKLPDKTKQLIKRLLHKDEYKIIDEFLSKEDRKAIVDLNKYDVVHFHSSKAMYKAKDSLRDYKGIVLFTTHSPKATHKELIEDDIPREEYLKHKEEYDKLEIIDEYAFNRANYIIFPTK